MPGVEGDTAAVLAGDSGARGLEVTPRAALPGLPGEGSTSSTPIDVLHRRAIGR